jgi:hypothetical protein
MQLIASHNIPLLLKVKLTRHTIESSPEGAFEIALLFDTHVKGKLIPMKATEVNLTQPLFVIEGMRGGRLQEEEPKEHYLQRLLRLDLMHLLHLNYAQHTQYTSDGSMKAGTAPLEGKNPLDSIEGLKANPQERQRLELMVTEAKRIGCSLQNMQLLCVTHIFSDTLGSQLNKKVTLTEVPGGSV